MLSRELIAAYRRAREWQAATYGNSGLRLPDGRGGYRDARQFTGGGACYQSHAIAAYWAARRSIHFRETGAQAAAQYKRRSAAARKAWAKRRERESCHA